MTKKLVIISFIALLLSCTKENDKISVEYSVSKAFSSIDLVFQNEDSKLMNETLDFNSAEDEWTYKTEMLPGEIVYLSAVYFDSTSSVNVQIKIDGKIYKQAYTIYEPDKYVIVSGTVPYK
ncbi:MAG: hypothetical protein K9G76_06695 [Bacteroidales bacterium]|nr:hypothetical protein [Bacteroidales bacterium]MCF8404335.1 hypothetical protein [Bacteroidales bacterium]